MIFFEGHKVYMNGDYPSIWLNGKSQHVHRLVWEKHNGVIPKGCVVHHRDENKLNWDIENLELLTRAEHLGEHRDVVKQKGVKVVATKDGLTIEFDTIKEAAEFCGTYTCSIQRCLKRKQHSANGWKFAKDGGSYSVL